MTYRHMILLSIFLFQGCFTPMVTKKIIGTPMTPEYSNVKSARYNYKNEIEISFEETYSDSAACVAFRLSEIPIELGNTNREDPMQFSDCENQLDALEETIVTPGKDTLLVIGENIYRIRDVGLSFGEIIYLEGLETNAYPTELLVVHNIYSNLKDSDSKAEFYLQLSNGKRVYVENTQKTSKILDPMYIFKVKSNKERTVTHVYPVEKFPGSGIVLAGGKKYFWQSERIFLIQFPETGRPNKWKLLPQDAILAKKKKNLSMLFVWPFALATDIVITALLGTVFALAAPQIPGIIIRSKK